MSHFLTRRPMCAFAAWLALLCTAGTLGASSMLGTEEPHPAYSRAPRLTPDYTGVVIPPNIAPMNFKVEEAGRSYRVQFHSTRGKRIDIPSRRASIWIPSRQWRELLSANRGEPLYCEVSVQNLQNQWERFETVTNLIAREDIDSVLVYRLLKPLYSLYVDIGIYQRDLESFQERPVLENRNIGHNCLNCHTFLNHRPDTFALHIRTSSNSHPMVLVQSNEAARVDKTMGYLAWHPSGRLLAFSANKFSLFYHTRGETRDVFDARSNLGMYRLDSNSVVIPPALALADRNLTWPAWSPDGHYLYYCSAPRLPVEQFRQVRYDLMRISYDIEKDEWGEPETLLPAEQSGLSAAEPVVSPDGRYVLFCLCKHGSFPPYQPSSNLYLIDLQTHTCRRLNINSDQADTWHCWSSNGRWLVFSSKRLDGLLSRPFFSYVDAQTEFSKPFLLPQADPEFYDSFPKNFNRPELISGPIQVSESELAGAVLKPKKVLSPKGDTRPPAKGQATGEPVADSGGEGQQSLPTQK